MKKTKLMGYTKQYIKDIHQIVDGLDIQKIEFMVKLLTDLRKKKGRLFFLGVGGGAGNAAHAVNDFRKICGIESYAPTDNISELSARINDDGWNSVFVRWLMCSRLRKNDGIFIFSVGGGNVEKNISVNLVKALEYAKKTGAKIFGIVGRDGGITAQIADACLIIPTVNSETITPHTEAFQAVIWHLIVCHPEMKITEMKWESVKY